MDVSSSRVYRNLRDKLSKVGQAALELATSSAITADALCNESWISRDMWDKILSKILVFDFAACADGALSSVVELSDSFYEASCWLVSTGIKILREAFWNCWRAACCATCAASRTPCTRCRRLASVFNQAWKNKNSVWVHRVCEVRRRIGE